MGNLSTSKENHTKWMREELHIFYPAVLLEGVSHARLSPVRPMGSNPGVDAECGLSLLLVFSLASRAFSPVTPVLPSP